MEVIMGRLRKAKTDQFIRLRSKRYTQNETAEKVDVNLKTVRKYDPVKRPKYPYLGGRFSAALTRRVLDVR